VLDAEPDDADKIVLRLWKDDPRGLNLVNAGVGGIEGARDGIEADFT